MLDSPAGDSFRYALNPELLKLYAAIVVGLSGLSLSQYDLFDALVEPLGFLLSAPFFLFGLVFSAGGVVGVLHRVLSDTRKTPE
ncbi:hypothetical protein C499_01160 [Halogeometricum borinquense DSM 11551]|uniref:Uncharacterized protein n=1 Tax=Halogeometricum borinquense (strain ATCC 700274 / DSM 11551 / JCM 10706 / KCTC 4070 / PR3) TaxID=469382 RepID=E4NLU2_HALBP|nr:hypothetical protein [Halogeometricum borinquense]ADQ68392.1 hypothetical protein Hbor_28510 [Halogeometricum borinquense DSM 11551]ELY31354.1 hypothetical protein C499_01160 [Halogeometricum borinquense DSM 11551]